jgi:hypothetical protein
MEVQFSMIEEVLGKRYPVNAAGYKTLTAPSYLLLVSELIETLEAFLRQPGLLPEIREQIIQRLFFLNVIAAGTLPSNEVTLIVKEAI